MPVGVGVLAQVGALLVAVFVGVAAVHAGRSARGRVRGWGGVPGREGPGWLFRDREQLVFVRGMRRYLLPDQPAGGQAVRRVVPRHRGQPVELQAHVFRGSDYRVRVVAVADRARPPRTDGPLTALPLLPRWALIPAVALAVAVPFLGVWSAGSTVAATVGATVSVSAASGPEGTFSAHCPVSWTGADEQVHVSVVDCAGAPVGATLAVRALAAPFADTALSPPDDDAQLAATVAGAAVLLLGALGAYALAVVRRRPVSLRPVLSSARHFDGSMPNAERHRAETMPSTTWP